MVPAAAAPGFDAGGEDGGGRPRAGTAGPGGARGLRVHGSGASESDREALRRSGPIAACWVP